jgi:hypothetical protein
MVSSCLISTLRHYFLSSSLPLFLWATSAILSKSAQVEDSLYSRIRLPVPRTTATDNAQATLSNNTFTQTNNTSTEDLLKLITTLRQSAASFPTHTREEIETDLEDLEAEITKPPADRNLTRIKKRLIAIFTAATLLAGGVSGATDFTNTAIDLGQKFDIDIPALVGH